MKPILPHPPIDEQRLLLHTCCAPCASAIVEALIANGLQPTLFFYNPNIFPESEYLRRKQEVMRHAESLGLEMVDADYRHDEWLDAIRGHENEPERGKRCLQCFEMRLSAAAHYAATHDFKLLATTLSTSRWKNIEQINAAGNAATAAYPSLTFWGQNWRKGGLQQRRSELIAEYGFYNQTYCGCEFSQNNQTPSKKTV